MIFRSGREFLEQNDPLRFDTSFAGGGTEEGMPQTRNFEEETFMAAVSGELDDYIKETVPRSKERR